MLKLLAVLACAAPLGLFVAYGTAHRLYNAGHGNDLELVADFETGDLSQLEEQGTLQVCCPDSIAVVDAPARAGQHAVRFRLRREDPKVKGGVRSEFRMKAAEMGSEYWYSMSIFLEPDWQVGAAPVTIAQWHAVPDKLLAESGRPPPLRLAAQDGRWFVASIWDPKRISKTPFTEQTSADGHLEWIGPLETGRWTDWVFRVRWSYEDDGLLEVWKDREAVYRQEGPNAYNDALAPYLKVGLYIPNWDEGENVADQQTIHFDEIRATGQPRTAQEVLGPARAAVRTFEK
jgi:hypothetical protein